MLHTFFFFLAIVFIDTSISIFLVQLFLKSPILFFCFFLGGGLAHSPIEYK